MPIARPSIRLDGAIITLATTTTLIYAIPSSAIGEIDCLTVYNSDTVDRTYNLILTRNAISIQLSPTNHVIPAGSIWVYEKQEIRHYLRGGESDKLEGTASANSVIKVCLSMLQLDINA